MMFNQWGCSKHMGDLHDDFLGEVLINFYYVKHMRNRYEINLVSNYIPNKEENIGFEKCKSKMFY